MDRDGSLIDDPLRFESAEEAFDFIRASGRLSDGEMDLGELALALGLVFLPGLSADRFRRHLHKLSEQVRDEYALRLKKEDDSLALRLSVLQKVLHELNGYHGDDKTYDNIENANLVRVIERRRGLPVALGILYIVTARAQGWDIEGLNFPGHFLLRMDSDHIRLIVDPFRDGREMTAPDLRQLLKTLVGPQAELSADYYIPVSAREILIRLQNNLKKRFIDHEDYVQAVLVAETIEALAPDDYRILFDKGVLYAKLGDKWQARTALESYIARAPSALDRADAQAILRQLD